LTTVSSDALEAGDVAEAGTPRPFYGRPYAWTWFAVVLFALPAAAYAVQTNPEWNQLHPALNAILNATSAVFLAVGYVAIRNGMRVFHRACMVTAFSR